MARALVALSVLILPVGCENAAIAFRQLPPFGVAPQPGPALIEPGPAATPGLGLKVGQADLTIDWVIP